MWGCAGDNSERSSGVRVADPKGRRGRPAGRHRPYLTLIARRRGRPNRRHQARLPRPALNVVAVRPGRDHLAVPQRKGPASRFMCAGILSRRGPHVGADLVRAQAEGRPSRSGCIDRPGLCHLDGMRVIAIENDQLRSAQIAAGADCRGHGHGCPCCDTAAGWCHHRTHDDEGENGHRECDDPGDPALHDAPGYSSAGWVDRPSKRPYRPR